MNRRRHVRGLAATAEERKRPVVSHPGPSEALGLGVDVFGGPVVDPTANVRELVFEQARRQDDLRLASQELSEVRARHLKEIADLRAMHAETLRTSDLDRLDKTRQVDVLAGTASAAALATAVQTLANTSDRNADTLRNLVSSTAQTMAKQTSDLAATLSAQTDSLVKDINARIAELQKSSYQGVGKSSVSDPMMERVALMVEGLARSQAAGAGKSAGISAVWVAVLGCVTLVSGLLGIAGVLYAVLRP